MSRPLWQRLSFAALALVMSLHFAVCYARELCCAWNDIYIFAYGDPGIAYRPRLLMRYVYRLVYALTQDKPPGFAHGVMSPQAIAIFSISFVSMLAIVYLTRAAIGVELGKQSPARWFALLTVYMCCYQYILVPQNPVAFPYDTPAVAAFAIALYAMLSRKRWMFYAVIVVASFNRETTFFLPPMFLILKLDPSVSLLTALKRVRISLWTEAAFQILVQRLNQSRSGSDPRGAAEHSLPSIAAALADPSCDLRVPVVAVCPVFPSRWEHKPPAHRIAVSVLVYRNDVEG